mmetsp:Transcript_26709/g.85669  ORF Transcript_26709/g.85669 Transcript_26709/m.85669 type:complete len:269 (+) Transcript_26709:689-1495(+)
MERVHEQGDQAVRPRAGDGHVGLLGAERHAPRRGHERGRGAGLGRGQGFATPDDGRAPRPCRHSVVERALLVVGLARPDHLHARRARRAALHLAAGRAQAGGLRAALGARRGAARVGRQRQQALHLVPARNLAAAPLLRPHRRSQGAGVVAAPERAPRLGRGHRRPLHPLLEHPDRHRPLGARHGLAGVQPLLVVHCQRARLVARLLAEPDRRLALLEHGQGRYAERPHHACALPRSLSRRADSRLWRRRRDASLLECLPAGAPHNGR